MSGSRGEANFVWRCKSCKVQNPIPFCCGYDFDPIAVPEGVYRFHQNRSVTIRACITSHHTEDYRV